MLKSSLCEVVRHFGQTGAAPSDQARHYRWLPHGSSSLLSPIYQLLFSRFFQIQLIRVTLPCCLKPCAFVYLQKYVCFILRKVTVTQISTLYNGDERKSIPKHISYVSNNSQKVMLRLQKIELKYKYKYKYKYDL